MNRIDSSNAGPNGEWLAGNPITGVKPTAATAAWFNGIQENLCRYIESQGITLDKTDYTLLSQAIAHHISEAVAGLSSGGSSSSIANSITQAMIDAWNAKAAGNHSHSGYAATSHGHLASHITQDSTHRFVTDAEKAGWNQAELGVKWDSGWFAVSLGQQYTKQHTLGEIPLSARLLLKSSAGKIVVANSVMFNSGMSPLGFFGSTIQDITETSISITTGNSGLWHGATGNGNNFSTGFARIIV